MTAAEIYPDIWTNSTDELDYLMSHYTELRRFYHAAATSGQAVLLAITLTSTPICPRSSTAPGVSQHAH